MKEYQVRYSRLARNDIAEIYDYLARNADKSKSDNVVDDIVLKAQSLRVFPEGGQTIILKFNVRYTSCGHYKIIYQVRKSDKVVVVLRVLHSKRNITLSDIDDVV